MSAIKSYRDLVVWQKSMALAKAVYDVTRSYPNDEKFGLTSQMRRAAVSVAANIAEGHARCSTGEFRQALGIAAGSLAELETLVQLSESLGILSSEKANPLLAGCGEAGRLLNGLARSLARPKKI